MTLIQDIHKHLLAIKADPYTPEGICGNFYKRTQALYNYNELDRYLDNLMSNWPDTITGVKYASIYPVDGQDRYNEDAEKGTLWDNPRRHQLLDWLIERTR